MLMTLLICLSICIDGFIPFITFISYLNPDALIIKNIFLNKDNKINLLKSMFLYVFFGVLGAFLGYLIGSKQPPFLNIDENNATAFQLFLLRIGGRQWISLIGDNWYLYIIGKSLFFPGIMPLITFFTGNLNVNYIFFILICILSKLIRFTFFFILIKLFFSHRTYQEADKFIDNISHVGMMIGIIYIAKLFQF